MRQDGRTDRHDEANSRFSQFREISQKLRNNLSDYLYGLLLFFPRLPREQFHKNGGELLPLQDLRLRL